MPASTYTNLALAEQLLNALDALSGLHPGFRPAHAKGLMCSGAFTPSSEAAKLTRAPHAGKPSTPVTLRYSDSTGVPTIPDNDLQRSGPRGIAVRFHLGDHAHTDLVAHSTNGFPVHTGEEFLEFLRAAAAFGGGKPEALGAFLAAHPNAKRFLEAPKPIPTSFTREAFFAVTAFQFTNAQGVSRHGRFRIRPEAGTEYLSNEEAVKKSPNFLFEGIGESLAKGPIKLGVFVQSAGEGDGPYRCQRDLVRRPPGGCIRHNHSNQVGDRPGAGAAEDHLRPPSSSRWHRLVGRPPDRGAVRVVPAERAETPSGE